MAEARRLRGEGPLAAWGILLAAAALLPGCGGPNLPLLPRFPAGWTVSSLPPASTGAAGAEDRQTLLPGDRVRVSVRNLPDLNQDYDIPDSGEVEMYRSEVEGQPRRTIQALGKTLTEFKDAVAKLYHTDLLQELPYVQVAMLAEAPRVVYVRGAVKSSSGMLPLPRTGPRMTLFRAIQASGGWTEDADLSRVVISRTDPATGAQVSLPSYDLEEMQEQAAYDRDPPLQAGDIVTVPTVGHVWISGHVNAPGMYPCYRKTTMAKVITLAGGLKQFAKKGDIRTIRAQGTSGQAAYTTDYDDIVDGKSYDPVLAPEDRILVYEDWK